MAPSRRKRTSAIITLVTIIVIAVFVSAISPWIGPFFGRTSAPNSTKQRDYSCTALTPLAARPELALGATGACVGVLQDRLVTLDLADEDAFTPNIFDVTLEETVKQFQVTTHIQRDGVVGRQTWEKLAEATTAAPSPAPPSPSPETTPSPPATIPPPSVTIEPLPHPAPPKVHPSPPSHVSPSTPAYSVRYGPNMTRHQVLTFDDCPRSLRQFKETIAAAADLGVSLVLAPRADCVHSGLFDVLEARKAGHFVINHSINHPQYLKMDQKAIEKQLTHDAFRSNYARPPYGQGGFNEPGSNVIKKAFAAAGVTMWNWSVDTEDWKIQPNGAPKSLDDILATIERETPTSNTRGDTILMHMQYNAFSPIAIKRIVALLEKKGLSVCPNNGQVAPEYPTQADVCQ